MVVVHFGTKVEKNMNVLIIRRECQIASGMSQTVSVFYRFVGSWVISVS